jgi:hypothetical protein
MKVDVRADNEVEAKIAAGDYQLDPNDQQQLWIMQKISNVWSEPPPDDHLHVYVTVPFLSQSHPPLTPDISLRSNTVSALYKKLKKYRFILVRGTPASGKTTLTRLLAQYIRQQEPAVDIIPVHRWPPESVRGIGGWQAYLLARGWQQNKKRNFIFDEAQMSYEDVDLWGDFFKNIGIYEGPFAIAFASYGSPTTCSTIQK